MAQFLDLPPEIRLEIYRYLRGNHRIRAGVYDFFDVYYYVDWTAMLRTNRIIYSEALTVLSGMVKETKYEEVVEA